MKFAVVGGGIAGLSAAWELAGAGGAGVDVTVYEPGHLGGKLRTSEFLGRPVDEGPDSILTRVPEGLALCRELGLGEAVEATQANRALLFAGGELRPLPEGLVLGVPARLLPLLRSGILSRKGIGRASLDLVLPRSGQAGAGQARTGQTRSGQGTSGPDGDVSVFDLVASRLGPEVAERLVEPLLGSIHAGSTRQLSAAATAPQLLSAARANRSLIAGLRKTVQTPLPAGGGANPLFVAPRQGMQALADRLVERLGAAGTTFRPAEVTKVRREQRCVVLGPDGERFDGVILAVPAPVAFSLLEPVLGDNVLPPVAAMNFASVAVVTLAFAAAGPDELRGPHASPNTSGRPDRERLDLDGISGILVAPGSGLMMTACSFGSNKWPHWAAAGTTVMRISVGRVADQSWTALGDEALVERLCQELGTVLSRSPRANGTRLPAPSAWRVSRWPRSMPQYEVGHLDRVTSGRALLARCAPMVSLAGASYNGVGVPACIASGRRAAREVLAAVEPLGLPAW
jgi:protoporphyrinogen/coproporphyrinogen III oxidase